MTYDPSTDPTPDTPEPPNPWKPGTAEHFAHERNRQRGACMFCHTPLRRDTDADQWADPRGQVVCAARGTGHRPHMPAERLTEVAEATAVDAARAGAILVAAALEHPMPVNAAAAIMLRWFRLNYPDLTWPETVTAQGQDVAPSRVVTHTARIPLDEVTAYPHEPDPAAGRITGGGRTAAVCRFCGEQVVRGEDDEPWELARVPFQGEDLTECAERSAHTERARLVGPSWPHVRIPETPDPARGIAPDPDYGTCLLCRHQITRTETGVWTLAEPHSVPADDMECPARVHVAAPHRPPDTIRPSRWALIREATCTFCGNEIRQYKDSPWTCGGDEECPGNGGMYRPVAETHGDAPGHQPHTVRSLIGGQDVQRCSGCTAEVAWSVNAWVNVNTGSNVCPAPLGEERPDQLHEPGEGKGCRGCGRLLRMVERQFGRTLGMVWVDPDDLAWCPRTLTPAAGLMPEVEGTYSAWQMDPWPHGPVTITTGHATSPRAEDVQEQTVRIENPHWAKHIEYRQPNRTWGVCGGCGRDLALMDAGGTDIWVRRDAEAAGITGLECRGREPVDTEHVEAAGRRIAADVKRKPPTYDVLGAPAGHTGITLYRDSSPVSEFTPRAALRIAADLLSLALDQLNTEDS